MLVTAFDISMLINESQYLNASSSIYVPDVIITSSNLSFFIYGHAIAGIFAFLIGQRLKALYPIDVTLSAISI